MKSSTPSLTASAVVVVSCLVWTGAITVALVHYFVLPAVVGWIIAGVLVSLATLAVICVLYEMRHAAVLTDHGECADSPLSPAPPPPEIVSQHSQIWGEQSPPVIPDGEIKIRLFRPI